MAAARVRIKLGWPEAVVTSVVVLATVAALSRPTPLLQTRSLTADHLVFPVRVGDQPPAPVGAVTIAVVEPACIELRVPSGTVPGPICNRHLLFPSNHGWPLQVYRLAEPGTFYAETGSACDSSQCDFRGMAFAADGHRLDDGPFDRVVGRLGVVGLVGVACGLALVVRSILSRRPSWWSRAGEVVAFGLALGMLWWNR